MTRVHDMGGRYGDGAVVPEDEDGPVFAEDWHGRVLALTLAGGAPGQWNIDMSRHGRERLSPKDYARFSYYEKWVSTLADMLVEHGVLTLDDLRDTTADPAGALDPRAMPAGAVAGILSSGKPADRDSNIASVFQVGQAVRTLRPAGNRLVDGGHTRLPAYAAGATGRIVRLHGCHVLPDSAAHGLGEAPEPLYGVAFAASELWTDPEHPGDEVVLDLWQSYLEPV